MLRRNRSIEAFVHVPRRQGWLGGEGGLGGCLGRGLTEQPNLQDGEVGAELVGKEDRGQVGRWVMSSRNYIN